MNLYEATTEVHHDAEHSRFGELLKTATVSKQQYADWLFAQHNVHSIIDSYLPPQARRLPELYLDLADLSDVEPKGSKGLMKLMDPLYRGSPTTLYIGGLCYVFTGAHLRGGPQNRRPLEEAGFPCRHLRFDREDAKKVDEYLKKLRKMPQFAEPAKEVFRNVLALMDDLANE